VLTLLWIPDSQVRAGTLYPRGHCGYCTPGTTGTLGALHPFQAMAGWGTGRLGYPSTAQLPYSYRLHPPTPLRWAGDWAWGPNYKHDLKVRGG